MLILQTIHSKEMYAGIDYQTRKRKNTIFPEKEMNKKAKDRIFSEKGMNK